MDRQWFTSKEKMPNEGEIIQMRYDNNPSGWVSNSFPYYRDGPAGRALLEDMQWSYADKPTTDRAATSPNLIQKRRLLQERIGQLIIEFHQENPELDVTSLAVVATQTAAGVDHFIGVEATIKVK